MSYALGDSIAPFEIDAVSTEAMKTWAIFLADPNPIHIDANAVKARGLGDRVINQGPINVAYMMNMLMNAFPGGVIKEMDTRFLDNVYGGDRVIASGRIVAIDGDQIQCEFNLDVDGRGTVNAGSATIRLNSEEK